MPPEPGQSQNGLLCDIRLDQKQSESGNNEQSNRLRGRGRGPAAPGVLGPGRGGRRQPGPDHRVPKLPPHRRHPQHRLQQPGQEARAGGRRRHRDRQEQGPRVPGQAAVIHQHLLQRGASAVPRDRLLRVWGQHTRARAQE